MVEWWWLLIAAYAGYLLGWGVSDDRSAKLLARAKLLGEADAIQDIFREVFGRSPSSREVARIHLRVVSGTKGNEDKIEHRRQRISRAKKFRQ